MLHTTRIIAERPAIVTSSVADPLEDVGEKAVVVPVSGLSNFTFAFGFSPLNIIVIQLVLSSSYVNWGPQFVSHNFLLLV
jgi:hypothetical protein